MKRILVGFLALLLVCRSDAWGDTCAVSLMPAFNANQAIGLCKTFGSAMNQSLIPSTDNTYDLGSATKTWRTLYTGTSRIAKTSDILRVRQDPQRLFTWDGSSDTALTETFGDGGVTAVQQLTISASTADADDDSTLFLSGGGAATSDGSRGGYIQLAGEEVAGGGDITYNAGASDTHIFQVGGSTDWVIDSAITQDGTNGGNIIQTKAGTSYYNGLAAIPATVTAKSGGGVREFISGDTSSNHGEAFVASANNSSGFQIDMFKTRSTDGTGTTIVQNNDTVGEIYFYGSNGTPGYTVGADISAQIDGVPGATTDMPTRLRFYTVPDGSGTLTQALELNSAQAATFAGTVNLSAAKDVNFSVGLATIALQESVAGTACSGAITANGATPVAYSTTCWTTGSHVFLTKTSSSAVNGSCYISATSNGVSFTITCQATDTGTYGWFITHEAP